MAPRESSSEEESDSGSRPVAAAQLRRGNFGDEEDQEDVADAWDAESDSEDEETKAKKAAEAKAKAAAAAVPKKSRTERMQEHIAVRQKSAEDDADSQVEESAAQRRKRELAQQKEADLAFAEDMLGAGGSNGRTSTKGTVVPLDSKDPNNTVDLATLPVFKPVTKAQFDLTVTTVVATLSGSAKRPQYPLAIQELVKQLAKDLSSEQIKKMASSLTALSNEKMKQEKAAAGGPKKKATKKAVPRVEREDDFGNDYSFAGAADDAGAAETVNAGNKAIPSDVWE